MPIRPYFAFAGNCRQAFTRYQEVFGGELRLLTGEDVPPGAGSPPGSSTDLIIHAAVGLARGAVPRSRRSVRRVRRTSAGYVRNVVLENPGEANRVFDTVAEEGQVQMQLGETFFSPAFGMCIDRFGTPWMVMVQQ